MRFTPWIKLARRRLERSLVRPLCAWSPGSHFFGPPKRLASSTEQWIRAWQAGGNTGADYFQLDPPRAMQRVAPRMLDGAICPPFEHNLTHLAPTTFLATIPAARVFAGDGAVIAPDDTLLSDLSVTFGGAGAQHPLRFRWSLGKPTRLAGTSVTLAAAGGNCFYHWMLDVLPRIGLLERGGVDWKDVDHVLVASLDHPFQRQSLAMLGVPSEKVRSLDEHRHVECQRLLAPSLVNRTGNVSGFDCWFLREKLAASLPQGGQRTPKRIYISRARASHRRVRNEKAVVALLETWGFAPFDLETVRLEDQIALLAGADAVAAPHGAGLTALAFCRPGTKVVEFFAPTYVNPCFWALANHLALDYSCLLGAGNPAGAANDDVGADMEVDLLALDRLLISAGLESQRKLAG